MHLEVLDSNAPFQPSYESRCVTHLSYSPDTIGLTRMDTLLKGSPLLLRISQAPSCTTSPTIQKRIAFVGSDARVRYSIKLSDVIFDHCVEDFGGRRAILYRLPLMFSDCTMSRRRLQKCELTSWHDVKCTYVNMPFCAQEST